MTAIIFLAVAVNFILLLASLGLSVSHFRGFSRHDYTWKGSDYPLEWPEAIHAPYASMSLRDTIRLPLNSSDSETAVQWLTMAEAPGGHGRMRLGPHKRVFVLAWYHQMHCLWQIQVALLDRGNEDATAGHIRHCLNYLRQTFLCDANTALEQGDFMESIHDPENPVVSDAICKDWEFIHEKTVENQANFEQYQKQWLN
ncbi:hypothetical protein DL96DRAFT_1562083 [Flagelloscypha sp. PMI_526]|nr:hypothetical protein DL96DRAFT_1562083 [Flagelloscypha sp. PMI_526]